MANIIISATINNFVDSVFLKNILILLKEEGYNFKTFLNNGNSVRFNKMEKFDLLIIVNKLTVDIPDNLDICTVYFSNRTHIENISDLLSVPYDFLFEYGTRHYLTVDYSFVPLRILLSDMQIKTSVNPVFDILFVFETSETFYKMLWFLNSMHGEQVGVFCKQNNSLLNDNVFIVTEEEFDDAICRSICVIGEGSLLLKAFLAEKPVLVVGRCGLGGVVNSENFRGLLTQGFIGRVGGSENEMIPKNLLLHEYSLLKDLNIESIIELKRAVLIELESQKMLIKEVFRRLIANNDGLNYELTFSANTQFGYSAISDSSLYIVYNKFSNQLLFTVTDEEYKLISILERPQKLKEAVKSMGYISNEKIQLIVKKLIRAKAVRAVIKI